MVEDVWGPGIGPTAVTIGGGASTYFLWIAGTMTVTFIALASVKRHVPRPVFGTKAAVPIASTHEHSAQFHQHGCAHAAHQLLAGIDAGRNRYAGFFGSGCDCFAF